MPAHKQLRPESVTQLNQWNYMETQRCQSTAGQTDPQMRMYKAYSASTQDMKVVKKFMKPRHDSVKHPERDSIAKSLESQNKKNYEFFKSRLLRHDRHRYSSSKKRKAAPDGDKDSGSEILDLKINVEPA